MLGVVPQSMWMSEDNHGVVGSLLSQRLKCGWQAWQQVPLPTEPSHWP